MRATDAGAKSAETPRNERNEKLTRTDDNAERDERDELKRADLEHVYPVTVAVQRGRSESSVAYMRPRIRGWATEGGVKTVSVTATLVEMRSGHPLSDAPDHPLFSGLHALPALRLARGG